MPDGIESFRGAALAADLCQSAKASERDDMFNTADRFDFVRSLVLESLRPEHHSSYKSCRGLLGTFAAFSGSQISS